jgi:enterochelin esterase-like enzyme
LDKGSYGRDLPFLVYLPPCHGSVIRKWPVIYLLHGLAGDYQFWPELGVIEIAEAAAQGQPGAGFLLVMPWQRTGLEFELAMRDGLLPHVERVYGASAEPGERAVGGISRGGGWALHLAFRHPGIFSRVGLHSPALMTGDLFTLGNWLNDFEGDLPQVRIDVGDRDSLLPAVMELTTRLDELEIDYEFHLGSGRHEAEYWESNLTEYLSWYESGW